MKGYIAAFLIALWFVVVIFFIRLGTAAAQTPPEITTPDITVREDAPSIAIPITLSSDMGLSGFTIEVTFPTLTALDPDPLYGLTTTSSSATSITLSAVDLHGVISPGPNIPLATAQITPVVGSQGLTINVIRLDDDNGFPLSVTVSPGTITVLPYPTLPGLADKVADLDKDGLTEDINGNGRLDFHDLVMLFVHLDSAEVQQDPDLFDWNNNGVVDYDDVVEMFNQAIVGAG